MPDATLHDFEEVAFAVAEGVNPILPRPHLGQSAAWLAYIIDHLRAEVDRLQLALIEAQNPGIDMDEVRRMRAGGVG